jgi:rubrerythrin
MFDRWAIHRATTNLFRWRSIMKEQQLKELLLQALEQEIGGVHVYAAALRCARNEELRDEWDKYLQQTQGHELVLRTTLAELGIDTEQETPGRGILRSLGEALVAAMERALSEGSPEAAQIVACECVALAETKDHLDWELIAKCAEHAEGETAAALRAASAEVEDQEDEHLYHSKGWARELWIESLGMTPVLPPPEERRDVRSAMEAARAEQSRKRPERSRRTHT